MSNHSLVTAIQRAGIGVAVLAAVTLGGHWAQDFVAIDSCLDSGHVYDYSNERCDATAVTLPVISYSDRHPSLIGAALGLILVGMASALTAPWLGGSTLQLSFSGTMVLVIMGLAAWGLPGLTRLVLLVPIIGGAVWAFLRLRRTE